MCILLRMLLRNSNAQTRAQGKHAGYSSLTWNILVSSQSCASVLRFQVEAVKKRQKEEQEKGIPHLMLH
jgi:hypothetical protein